MKEQPFVEKFQRLLKIATAPLTMISLIAILACAPYLIWQKNQVGDIPWDLKGEWHWISTDAFAAMSNWRTYESQAGFVQEGGGGTACKVDPQLCTKINIAENQSPSPFSIYDSEPYSAKEFRDLGLTTLREHPVKWFTVKFPYFLKYWNSKPSIATPSGSDFPNSILSAIGLLILGTSFFARPIRKRWLGPASFGVVLMGATLLPPFLAHFEVRYLVAAKLVGFVIFCAASGFCLSQGIKKLRPLIS